MKKDDDIKNEPPKKQEYVRPKITTEELTAYGAVCNGMALGGRKTITGAPDFCNAARLLS